MDKKVKTELDNIVRVMDKAVCVLSAVVLLVGCGGKGDKGKTAEADLQLSSVAVDGETAAETQEEAGSARNVCAPEPYDAEENICPGGYGKGVLVDNLPADFVSKIDWKGANCTLCSTFQGHNIYTCILPGANLRQAYNIAKKLDADSELKPELPTAAVEYPCSGNKCEKVVYEYYPAALHINTSYKNGGNVAITITEGASCTELNVTYAWPLDEPDEDGI